MSICKERFTCLHTYFQTEQVIHMHISQCSFLSVTSCHFPLFWLKREANVILFPKISSCRLETNLSVDYTFQKVSLWTEQITCSVLLSFSACRWSKPLSLAVGSSCHIPRLNSRASTCLLSASYLILRSDISAMACYPLTRPFTTFIYIPTHPLARSTLNHHRFMPRFLQYPWHPSPSTGPTSSRSACFGQQILHTLALSLVSHSHFPRWRVCRF